MAAAMYNGINGCEATKKSNNRLTYLFSDITWPYQVINQDKAKIVPTSDSKRNSKSSTSSSEMHKLAKSHSFFIRFIHGFNKK